MKEFSYITPDKEIASHQHNKTTLTSRMQAVKGLPLWDYDPETKTLVRAQYEEVFDLGAREKVKKVITKPGHMYFQALNEKNARKKLAKAGC